MAITLRNRSFAIACACILALPGLSSFVVETTAISKIDARSLAALPGMADARADPWGYFHEVDAYLDDHFGLRPQLLQLNGWVRLASRSPASQDVVVGRDGWLFFAPGLVTERLDSSPEAHERLMAQADLLEALSERITAKGGRFAVMIAPDKHTIYPEQLPGWLAERSVSGAYDQMLDELRWRGVTVVDVRAVLLAAKAAAPTYYRTDTHWTRAGATVAFNELMKVWDLAPVVPDPPYRVRDADGPQFDLARKSLMGNHKDFRMREFTPPGGKPATTRCSARWTAATRTSGSRAPSNRTPTSTGRATSASP
jgi:hypothetical protein